MLRALIGKDGAVQSLTVTSGHPMLIQAAMDAVKQWRSLLSKLAEDSARRC